MSLTLTLLLVLLTTTWLSNWRAGLWEESLERRAIARHCVGSSKERGSRRLTKLRAKSGVLTRLSRVVDTREGVSLPVSCSMKCHWEVRTESSRLSELICDSENSGLVVDVRGEKERREAVREYPAPERIEIRWRKRQGKVNCLMASVQNRDDNEGWYGELKGAVYFVGRVEESKNWRRVEEERRIICSTATV